MPIRARDLNIPLNGTPGPLNALTDVPGVLVGTVTLISGDGPLVEGKGPVRTGVTAILPRGQKGIGKSCAAAWYSFNGNGEMTGVSWLEETGSLGGPILITNTHAVGPVHRGLIDWIARNNPEAAKQWLLPVVAETFDGYLNDINGNHVLAEHAIAAIDAAKSGAVEEGSVGGGTGMNCYGFKGGNGTSSRVVPYGDCNYTVGVFVQANFGSRHELTIAGHALGQQLGADNPIDDFYNGIAAAQGSGSCIGVVATDAPLLPQQCKALARRVMLGLARTGATGSHFSGDIFIGFSSANAGALDSLFHDTPPHAKDNPKLEIIPWGRMNDFYAATVYAAEEAVLNAMINNREMIGRDGNRSPALPHDVMRKVFIS